MDPKVQILRSQDGHQHVVLDLEDFQALLDARDLALHGPADLNAVVERLAAVLEEPRSDLMDLDAFLERYDALHGQD